MNDISNRKGREFHKEPLSKREIEILELIADNLSKREIADTLSLAYSAVKWYTQQMYQKLGVNSRRQAVLRARELGLLKTPASVETTAEVDPDAWIANPYKGLLAFQESDAANFFGREALTERLVARLGEEGETSRFLAVVGSSGSGKSSLVKAGLLPALRQGAPMESEDWAIVEITPGIHPFAALWVGLRGIAGEHSKHLPEVLQKDDLGILDGVRLSLPDSSNEMLLLIDQFEEIFTLVEDKAEARAFLRGLYMAVTEPHSLLRVIIALRADFYNNLLETPDISRLVQDRTEVVIPLTVEELERAVLRPAEQAGVRMQPELVAAIIADMVKQPGALPLLQYALSEIFEKHTGNQLTLESYQHIGGLQSVIEQRAEETFKQLSPEGKSAARQVLLRLVALGEGAGVNGLPAPDTRRRALSAELEAVASPSLPTSSEGILPKRGTPVRRAGS